MSIPTLSNVAPVSLVPGDSLGEKEFDLNDLVGVLLAGMPILLAVVAATVAIGSFYAWSALRVYPADALVQVELDDKKSVTDALGDLAELLGDQSSVGAEVELIRSRLLIGSVVDELNLTVQIRPRYFPIIGAPLSRMSLLAQDDESKSGKAVSRYVWGKASADVPSFDVPETLFGREFYLERSATGVVLSLDGVVVIQGAVGTKLEGIAEGKPISIFVKDISAPIGAEFQLTKVSRMDRIASLADRLRVAEKAKDSGMLAVTFEAYEPALARDFVNKLVTAYQRQNVERRSAEAEQTLEFLRQQLPKLRKQVEAAEASLNDYRLKQGSADLSKETDLILQESVALETSRRELEQSREEALQRFTPNHPTIQAIDRQRQQVKQELDGITARVKNLPETQQELLRLTRDMEVNSTLYTSLLNSYQELQVVKAGTVGNVRVVDYAVATAAPSQPKTLLIIVVSFVIGTFLGLVVVFVRKSLHSGIDDPSEVEKKLGIATYCSVPFSDAQVKIARLLRQKNRTVPEPLLALADSSGSAVEALRGLRTSLHFGQLEAKNNIVMLTGPSPGLGKSFISANLSAVLAMSGRKVIVVDCDLRRGHLHEYFGTEREPGFSDYVAGTATIDSIVKPTKVPGLSFLATGTVPPNPAELLLSDKVGQLLAVLSKEFDTVILDTPPVLAVTDAVVMGRFAGTTLFVLKAGEHSMRMIEDSVKRLQVAGVPIKGTIFNQIGLGARGRYGYKYGYSYGYYNYDYREKNL